MSKYSVRKVWGRFAGIAGLMAFMSFSPFIHGQSPSTTANTPSDNSPPTTTNDQPVTMEKYTVTGSNIQLASDELAIPTQTFDSLAIENSGVDTNTLDILRKIAPSIAGIGVENATISTADTYGGSALTLHGLPVLVLVNGHRLASDAAEAVGGDRFTDLNTIPPAAIDHIDVVPDGASAIYGSDAVGGVINILLKTDYNGFEADFHYGISPTTGHYNEKTVSLTGGVSSNGSSITISAGYTESTPILFSQRPGTANYYANNYIPGVIDIYDLATGNDEDYLLAPGVNAPPGGGQYTIQQLVAGVPGVNGGKPVYIDEGVDPAPGSLYFNFAQGQTLIESLKRSSVVVNFAHRFFQNLNATGDIEFAHTITKTQLNAQPLYPYVSDPYTDTWYNGGPPAPGTQYVLATDASNPFSTAYIDQAGDFNSGEGIDAHDRFLQFPRIFQNDATAFSASGALEADLLDNRFTATASGTISRYQLDYSNQNLIDAANFYAALGDGQLNPFAITQAPGVLPGNILGTGTMSGISTLSQGNFVVQGTPFSLPGGDLGVAVGGTYIRETLGATADSNTIQHLWLNSPTIEPIDKSRWDEAIFGEVNVPIVQKTNGVPGVAQLSVDIAGRYDYYERVGSASVPKVSVKYVPFDDQFALRFSAGKSFIAPVLYDLYGPVNVGSSNDITYTTAGGEQKTNVQMEAETGSNANLKPSTATTWVAGFTYTPRAVKGLTITADFFSTHQSSIVGDVDQQTVVQSVELLGANSPYVGDVHFGSPTGPTPTAPGQISAHPLSNVWLVTPLQNLGGDFTRGIDGQVEYQTPVTSYGKFDFKSTATVYNTARLWIVPSEPYYSYLGETSINDGTVPHYKLYSTGEWDWAGFSTVIGNLFVPSVVDAGSGGANIVANPKHVASYVQWDASVQYAFSHLHHKLLDGLTVRIGVDNAFNRQAPLAPDANSETYADIGYYGGAIGILTYTDVSLKF